MDPNTRGKTAQALVGLAWCVAVMGAYYGFNYPYYGEKISVFGRYILGLLR